MSQVRREQTIEFKCIGTCDDSLWWQVDGWFNAKGQFEPNNVDEVGSDADCPECGERGEPTDPDVVLADF